MRVLEAAAFLSLAGALHVAALSLADLPGGGTGGGAQGADSITLQASPAALAALVERWDTPPTGAQSPAVPKPPAAGSAPAAPTDVAAVHRIAPPERVAPIRPPSDLPTVESMPPATPAPVVAAAPIPPASPPAARRPDVPSSPADPAPERPAAERLAAAPPAPSPPRIDITPAALPSGAPARALRPMARPADFAPTRTDAPARQARLSAPSRAMQRAAGAVEDTPAARPRQTTRAEPAPGPAARSAAQARWGAGIRQAVARAQRYPANARARGTVTLRLTVAPSGRLTRAVVLRPSGNAALDRAAVEAARRARLPRAPDMLRDAAYVFDLPLAFARR